MAFAHVLLLATSSSVINTVCLIGCVLILILYMIQAFVVWRYWRAVNKDLVKEKRRDYQPDVTILLCLRGRDPYLDDCLQALLSQTYDDFRLCCVFDSPLDPARDTVRKFEKAPLLEIFVCEQHRDTCSLKCNSLIEVINSWQHDPELIVLVDADAVVDQHWLPDLVAPLADASVVAVSGNRWFLPESTSLGSDVRAIWNMGAAPQMHLYEMTWGGSLAIRSQFVRSSGLLDLWAKSLFEDASVGSLVKKNRKRVHLIPSLLIPNRESTTMQGASGFITRQLLDMRLYHGSFPMVVGHCWLTSLAIVAGSIGMAVSVFLSAWFCVYALLVCSFLMTAFYGITWWSLNRVAGKALRARGHDAPVVKFTEVPWRNILVTQAIYTCSVIAACLKKCVVWRGVQYNVRGAQQVQMLEYRPMRASSDDVSTSL